VLITNFKLSKMPHISPDEVTGAMQGRKGSVMPSLDIVEDISNEKLRLLLESLVADPGALAVAASHSHRHQLGFVKIVVQIEDSGECLRLHLWDKPIEMEEDIHSHCASFKSRIVLGEITENVFRLVPGNSHAMFDYRFDASVGHAVADEVGPTGVKIISSKVIKAGEIYAKRSGDLHNVSHAAEGTVTVSSWACRDSPALVIKDSGALAADCVVNVGMVANDLSAIVRKILSEIPR